MPIHDHTPSLRGRAFLWAGLVLGLLLVAALLTKGFGLVSGPAKAPEEPALMLRTGDKIVIPEGSPLRKRLSVQAAPVVTVSPKLVLPGVVESDPARTALVLTPLGGRLRELKVGLGDRVTKHQLLAVIESADLAQAYDDYDKAADLYKLTKKNLARQEAQSKLGAASDRDLDQARSDHAQAVSEYTRTKARLKVLDVPREEAGRPRLLDVRAPVAGSVTSIAVAPGNMINDPTQPVMTIADLSTVWVTALVSEKDVAVVAKGQDAEVSLASYPDRPLHGKVLFVSDVIEPDTRRNKIRIAFQNGDYAFKPNMFATVTLLAPQRQRITLPRSALLMNNDRTSVFVATAPWTFERRTVEPELEEGPTVVIASGLKEGEQVVVKGGILIND